ncbi:MAG: ABC transporter permease [Patescibacteria group bacterium]
MNTIRQLIVLTKKEFDYHYLISPLGLIFGSLFCLISGWLFFQDFFLINQASLSPFFLLLPFLLLFFLPAMTMNLFAEEKKSGTWEILLTLPTDEKSIVLAKFLASLAYASLIILLSLPLAITIGVIGSPDWGLILSSYLGAFLLSAAYLSTGILFSSLTDNPIIALISSTLVLLVNFFAGQEGVVSRLPNAIGHLIAFTSLNWQYQFFLKGNILLTGLVIIPSWVLICLLLTIVSLKSRDY